MPELPEVETVRRALVRHLPGRTIEDVDVNVDRLRTPLDRRALRRTCRGRRIAAIRRRAKYLLVDLDRGARGLLLHLGMTGSFRTCDRETPLDPYERVVFHLADGQDWRFRDVRRFGQVEAVPMAAGELPACLAGLGPEPLADGFDGASLKAACRGRRRDIKQTIMDQKIVVGVGNIYASEALHRSGIRPGRAAARLTGPDCERLVIQIRAVLEEALASGGSTIRDFASVNGQEGRFALSLRVYDREGEPCRACATPIRRIVQGGRSSFYCPACQS